MLASSLPTKFNISFGNNAVPANTNPIPQASQLGITPGAASLVDGFPPLTFIPISAGGIPPWGRDFNGLLNQITAWVRYSDCAGGLPTYDATFASAIGGYPQGALIASTTIGGMWLSTIDNNVSNPDTSFGANGAWVAIGFITQIQNEAYISADDTGTQNNIVLTTTPPIAGYVKYQRFQCKIANTSTGTGVGGVVVNIRGISGLLGTRNLVYADLSTPLPYMVNAGEIAMFVYDGTQFQLENSFPTLKIPIGSPIIYVRTDGNDNNDGRFNTPQSAMLTIQAALTRAQNIYALQGRVLTIQMGIAGTYAPFSMSNASGEITVRGDPSNRSSYIIAGAAPNNNAMIQVVGSGGQLDLVGVTVNCSSNVNIVACSFGGTLSLNQVVLNHVSGPNNFSAMIAQPGGSLFIKGPVSVTGTFNNSVINCSQGSWTNGTSTITLSVSAPSICIAAFCGVVTFSNTGNIVGSASGNRYAVTLNGVINTNSGNQNFIPGTAPGTVQSGGQYN